MASSVMPRRVTAESWAPRAPEGTMPVPNCGTTALLQLLRSEEGAATFLRTQVVQRREKVAATGATAVLQAVGEVRRQFHHAGGRHAVLRLRGLRFLQAHEAHAGLEVIDLVFLHELLHLTDFGRRQTVLLAGGSHGFGPGTRGALGVQLRL